MRERENFYENCLAEGPSREIHRENNKDDTSENILCAFLLHLSSLGLQGIDRLKALLRRLYTLAKIKHCSTKNYVRRC